MKDIAGRLRTVEGHVRGIERMVRNEADCVDLIHQIHAVQAAMDKIRLELLRNHLNTCLAKTASGEDREEHHQLLMEIVELYELASRA
jgi:DNA-binding FrmR family transcriptional regulator